MDLIKQFLDKWFANLSLVQVDLTELYLAYLDAEKKAVFDECEMHVIGRLEENSQLQLNARKYDDHCQYALHFFAISSNQMRIDDDLMVVDIIPSSNLRNAIRRMDEGRFLQSGKLLIKELQKSEIVIQELIMDDFRDFSNIEIPTFDDFLAKKSSKHANYVPGISKLWKMFVQDYCTEHNRRILLNAVRPQLMRFIERNNQFTLSSAGKNRSDVRRYWQYKLQDLIAFREDWKHLRVTVY
jgi:hypothetical protein